MPDQRPDQRPIEPIDLAIAKLEAVLAEAEKEREQLAKGLEVPEDVPRFVTCHG